MHGVSCFRPAAVLQPHRVVLRPGEEARASPRQPGLGRSGACFEVGSFPEESRERHVLCPLPTPPSWPRSGRPADGRREVSREMPRAPATALFRRQLFSGAWPRVQTWAPGRRWQRPASEPGAGLSPLCFMTLLRFPFWCSREPCPLHGPGRGARRSHVTPAPQASRARVGVNSASGPGPRPAASPAAPVTARCGRVSVTEAGV